MPFEHEIYTIIYVQVVPAQNLIVCTRVVVIMSLERKYCRNNKLSLYTLTTKLDYYHTRFQPCDLPLLFQADN